MSAQLLKEIVDRLNAPPFNKGLSLVCFDEQQPLELLETLNEVCANLDGTHEVDIRQEESEVTQQRIGDFIAVLGYQQNVDIEGIMMGSRNAVFPILHWILLNLEHLRKRVYLARFLVNIEVPEEFLKDEAIMAAYQTYKDLQAQFKISHATLEQERENSVVPTELKGEIQQLEVEKEQLVQKIGTLKTKTQNLEGFQQLLEITSSLRKEQEEEARLSERIKEQRMQLDAVEQQYYQLSQKLHEYNSNFAENTEGGAETMLRVLREEVKKHRQTSARYERAVETQSRQLEKLEGTLSESPVSQMEIEELEEQNAQLRETVKKLESRNESHQKESSLAIYRQQAKAAAQKKEAAEQELADLEEKRDALGSTLAEKEKEYEEKKGHKYWNAERFKQYASSLREKTVSYKECKSNLSQSRSEIAVLTRTEQILTQKTEALNKQIEHLAVRQGITGYQDTEATLEHVSSKRAQVDSEKGKTLQEMSDVVGRINASLKEKKIELAPQVTALRDIRKEHQELDAQYSERKRAYDSAKLTWDRTLSKQGEETGALQEDCDAAERTFHLSQLNLQLSQALLDRAQQESKCLRGEAKFSKTHASLCAYYTHKMTDMERQSKELRKKQRDLRDNQAHRLRQKEMFAGLRSLLQTKLNVATQSPSMKSTQDDFRLESAPGGVNRLFIY